MRHNGVMLSRERYEVFTVKQNFASAQDLNRIGRIMAESSHGAVKCDLHAFPVPDFGKRYMLGRLQFRRQQADVRTKSGGNGVPVPLKRIELECADKCFGLRHEFG